MTLVARELSLFGGIRRRADRWGREGRIANLGYSASEMGSSLDTVADLRYKMGQITATGRDKAPNRR